MLSEHLPLLAGAPDGIMKLRGLILELAVRGKLVPQDPKDEPASELLKRIAAEKARLVVEGKIRKDKPQQHIGEDEKPFELPGKWQWVRFEEIAQHNSGKTLDKGRNSGEPRQYITTSNLYWGHFELKSVRQMLINEDELERCTARKDDLLICEGGEAGRAAVWPHDYEICFQNHVHRARFFGGIDPYFAYRFFEKLNASGEIDQYRKGVGISNMSGKALASIPFPVPPVAEQHRIVAKVDELMALCDRMAAEQTDAEAAHATLVQTLLGTLTQSRDAAELAANWQRLSQHFDTLFITEASLDALKQAILQLAVMGKLVLQDPNDEPASELLKRIAIEKARLVAEGKVRKDKPLTPIGEEEKQFELPAGWEWVRLGDVSQNVQYGYTASADHTTRSVLMLRITDIQNDQVNWSSVPGCSIDAGNLPSYELTNGDILIARTGGTIGKSYLVEGLSDVAVFASYLIRVQRLDASFPQYTKTYLGSRLYWGQLFASSMGTGQPNVNGTALKSLLVPLPPFAEQHRIVAKVDELIALCDRLKADLAESRARQARLASALIESALQAA